MSGHNKWSKVKNIKAKNDAQNAKIFTKIGREIAVAVKAGGADPNTNTALKNLISKARSYNMPNDNINRSIKKASGEVNSINYEKITYEGYGPSGSAIIVEALTDNKNRTASDVRHIFDKFGGNLGSTGCVSYLFDNLGQFVFEQNEKLTEDDMTMLVLDSGADDMIVDDGCFIVSCQPANFDAVKKYFDDNNIAYLEAGVEMVPQSYITIPDDKIASFNKLIEGLEDNDDVQEVYHNVDNCDVE